MPLIVLTGKTKGSVLSLPNVVPGTGHDPVTSCFSDTHDKSQYRIRTRQRAILIQIGMDSDHVVKAQTTTKTTTAISTIPSSSRPVAAGVVVLWRVTRKDSEWPKHALEKYAELAYNTKQQNNDAPKSERLDWRPCAAYLGALLRWLPD
jgi:hypothetical protein